jgi:hypothetical protein
VLSKNTRDEKLLAMEVPSKQTTGASLIEKPQPIEPERAFSEVSGDYKSRVGLDVPSFTVALIVFFLVQTFVFFAPPAPLRKCYLAGTVEKHKLIAETPSPRVVIVGGSNVAFGFDSEYLQKQLGLPVINMGLHGGLGLRYSLNEIAPYIRKGDVYILSPEYPQFDDPDGDLTLLQLLTVYPRGLQYLAPENLIAFPRAFLQLSQFKRNWWGRAGFKSPSFDPVYNRSAFNNNGDVISHLGRMTPPHTNFPKELRLIGPTDSDTPALVALIKFEQACTNRGATVFFAFPAVVADYYKEPENLKNIKLLDTNLRHNTRLIILGTPDENVFPSTAFFDAVNHLNKAPRFQRTEHLLQDLKNDSSARKLFASQLN